MTNRESIDMWHQLRNQTELQLARAEARIAQLKEKIAYFQGVLAAIDSDGSIPTDTVEPILISDRANSKDRRTPKKMKRPQYLGLTAAESIEKVLASSQEPMSVDRIVETIFDTQSDEEFWTAKFYLGIELRSGAKGEFRRWKKLSKRLYASLLFDEKRWS